MESGCCRLNCNGRFWTSWGITGTRRDFPSTITSPLMTSRRLLRGIPTLGITYSQHGNESFPRWEQWFRTWFLGMVLDQPYVAVMCVVLDIFSPIWQDCNSAVPVSEWSILCEKSRKNSAKIT